jgi:hypothetical protein
MSANPAEVLFRAHHFQRVMSLLAQRSREHTNDWLLRMFYACQTPSKLGEGLRHAPDRALQLPDLADSSDVLPSFWAMWECARYCILHRLRTPFGGPMQTFEALERMLAAYATGNLAAVPALPALMTLQSPPPGSALVETQLPPRLLLLLIDHLEKQIYGAYEGSMSIDYHSNKATTAFFRTNQKVCTDWYARFRQPLVAASVACGATMDIIRHSMKRLSDLRYSILRYFVRCNLVLLALTNLVISQSGRLTEAEKGGTRSRNVAATHHAGAHPSTRVRRARGPLRLGANNA